MGEQLEKFQHIDFLARRDRRVITQVIASDLALTACYFITDKRTNGPSHKTSRLFDCCYFYQSALTLEKREVCRSVYVCVYISYRPPCSQMFR